MSRSGTTRSEATAPGSLVSYFSSARIVVSGLPKCWSPPLRVRGAKLVMSSGSPSWRSGSTKPPDVRARLRSSVGWSCWASTVALSWVIGPAFVTGH